MCTLKKSRGYQAECSRVNTEQRLSYFGHIVRMSEEKVPEYTPVWANRGNQPEIYRPRKKWIDNIDPRRLFVDGTFTDRGGQTCTPQEQIEICYTEVGLPARVDSSSPRHSM